MAKGYNNASNKRSNSSKPYDASNSFVKKVASRVTGLIPQTSWLSGWFSTSDEVSNRPDATQSARFQNEDEDSSDDQLDQPPPTKRLKLPDRNYEPELFTPSSGPSKDSKKSSQGDFFDVSSVPGPSGQHRGGSGNFVASTPAEQEHKANGDDCSESAESTSGCSSLEPQMNRAPGVAGQQARPNQSLPSRLDDRFNYPSYLQSPRSLFLDRSSNTPSASRRKPSFSVTSLNSSLFGDRSLNETMVNSPFYTGRTMYGGASSSPYRRSLASTSFTSPASSDKSGRHTVRVKPSPAQSNVDTGMSDTARRILATLEQFSTPLLDAKRIPVSNTPQPVLASTSRKRVRQETEEPRIVLNPPRSPQLTRKGVHWAKGPPIRELSMPTTPDTLLVHRKERIPSAADELLLRQKERLQDSTTAARRMANSVPASNIGLERTYSLRSEEDEPLSGKQQSLKMKQQRTKVHQSNDDKRNEAPVEVNLPKIALPITTLPSFDIPVAEATVTSPPPTAKVAVKSSTSQAAPTTPAIPKSSAAPFTFASPIVVSSDLKPISPVAFVFSKPDPVDEESSTPATGLNFLPSVPSRSDKQGLRRKSVTVNENGNDAVVFSLKPPSELRTGSVMDILGKGAKDTKEVNGSVSLMDKFKPAAGTWECDKCLIRNKADLSRCAACTSPRPAAGGKAASSVQIPIESPKVSSSAKNDSSFGAQFKLTGSDVWECSSCMVRNKSGSSACVACGTGKPGGAAAAAAATSAAASAAAAATSAAAATTAKPPPITSNWGDKFKPASNTWECEACMVRNSSDLTACQACTTKRPGVGPAVSAPATSNTASLTTSSWGDKFKKAEGSWDCSDCMITNKSAALKCVACGAKKPGTQGDEPKAAAAEEPTFSFGVPAGASGFTFGIKPSEKTEEKTASSGGFNIGTPAASVPTTGFTFGIPPAAQPSSAETATTTVTFTPPTVVAKPVFSFGVPKPTPDTTPTPEKSQKKVTFSFDQTASESTEPSRKRKSSAEASVATTSVESPKSSTPASIFSVSTNKETTETASPSNTFAASPSGAKSTESATPQKPTPVFGFSAGSPAGLFKFGTDSNTATANVPKTAPAPTPTPTVEEPKQNQETKPFFGAQSTPALNSTFAFGQSRSETPKPPIPTFSASTEMSTPAKTFTFGQSSSEALKSPKATEDSRPSEMFSATLKPTFMFGQSSTEAAKPAETSKPSVTFGAAPAADAPEKPAFNFQPSSDTAPKPLGGFGNPTNTSATPMFGSSTNAFPTFASSSTPAVPNFGSSASVNPTAANPTSPPTQTPASSTPMFGATNSVPTFGGSFGSTDKSEPKAPSLFTFGASKPAAATPFTFGAPALNGPTFGAQPAASKPFSAFNVAPTNTAPASTPSFGGFAASSSAPAAPSFGSSVSNTGSLFGNSTAPAFGAPTQPTFGAAPSPSPAFGAAPSANAAPAPAAQFNFSNTPSTPVFTFGGNQPQQNSAPAAPFSFTAKPTPTPPTFNPNATPNFNFTAGGTVNFTATPGEVKPNPQRVIKKAMRRTQPR